MKSKTPLLRLQLFLKKDCVEVGCDEAGRGCLAGDVYAAAVVLPEGFKNDTLNDSKQLSEKQRDELRTIIEREAVAWGVGVATVSEIEQINILNASILAMHRAVDKVQATLKELNHSLVEHIIVDGNRFKSYENIPYQTIVKGDGKYLSIAAASILAKTHRDEYMFNLHEKYPQYGWNSNKGYPTIKHRAGIAQYGTTPYHRMTFRLLSTQLTLEL